MINGILINVSAYKSKFANDTGFTIGSHLLVGICGLILNTLIGSFYGVRNLGIFNQALSIYMILTLVANFGVQTSAQKFGAQHSKDANHLKIVFSSAVFATLLSSAAIVMPFVLYLKFFPSVYNNKALLDTVFILVFAAPFFALNKTMNNFLVGIRKVKTYALIRLLRWFLIVFICLCISLKSFSFRYIPYSFVFSEVIITVSLLVELRRYFTYSKTKWYMSHLSFGVKSILSEFVATLHSRFPILLIGYSLGNEAAGYYSYIEVFAYSILMISGAVQKNFNTLFTNLWYSGNYNKVFEKIREVFNVLLRSVLPLLILIFVLYYIYTKLLMNSAYLDHIETIILLLVASGLRYIIGPFSTFLIMTGHLYGNLLRTLVYLAVNLVAMLLLISTVGLIGVPIALIISELANFLLIQSLYNKYISINLFDTLFNRA